MKLSSLKSKYIVDFWASYAVPCRSENLNPVNAYKKYRNTTFKNGKDLKYSCH